MDPCIQIPLFVVDVLQRSWPKRQNPCWRLTLWTNSLTRTKRELPSLGTLITNVLTSHSSNSPKRGWKCEIIRKFLCNYNFKEFLYLISSIHFSADFVFSNWLLMYLQDEEVKNLIKETLFWLREDGYLFCRESCYHQSGAHF